MADLADVAGVDVAEIALVENDLALLHLDTARAICEALDASLADVFPTLREVLDEMPNFDDEEFDTSSLSPDAAKAFLEAGLDPDASRWIASIKTKCGNEMKYPLSSPEMDYLVGALKAPPGKFIRFASDCRQIILRFDAIADVKLTDMSSCAPFSTRDSAFEITIFWANGSRPERVEVIPEADGEEGFQGALLGRGENVPAFVNMVTDEDETSRFISTDAIDAIEIPVGVVLPNIYKDTTPLRPYSSADDISKLVPVGTS